MSFTLTGINHLKIKSKNLGQYCLLKTNSEQKQKFRPDPKEETSSSNHRLFQVRVVHFREGKGSWFRLLFFNDPFNKAA